LGQNMNANRVRSVKSGGATRHAGESPAPCFRTRIAPVLGVLLLNCGLVRAIGPDVMVVNLSAPGFDRPNGYGSVDGVSAFAVGTTSCNVGTASLRWEQSTPRHPVIAQNMYRLKDHRFEQIGMAWVKHGFLATNENACGECANPGSGSLLHVGCSDPYSAGLNGDRRYLGARSQVNAHTGQFPYPPTRASNADAISGRLQVHDVDLDPEMNAGALYFAEGHYVAADDAQAGNGDNNASWREIGVDHSNPEPDVPYRIFRNGPDMPEQPAIYAWQAKDPAVEIDPVRVPGEGLFFLGASARNLGNGFWRYEYAIENLNSDRSGGSFEVPIPLGVVIMNAGFHDVDYHSGEPYDLTDWPITVNEDSIVWATTPFSGNINANALRWSTLYNFRFDANAEPSGTIVRLGLFKPGTPSEIPIQTVGPKLDLIDCNRNGLPDACDIDCGAAGGPCDLPSCGESIDCNGNLAPDDCELDCNNNGMADGCDLKSGSDDCNENGTPDECEPDCDGDGIPDVCDGSDLDGDGFNDCEDLCLESPCMNPPFPLCCYPGLNFCVNGLPADLCRLGGGVPDLPCRLGCHVGDADRDGDLDLFDYAEFQNCFSGYPGADGFVTPSEDCLLAFDTNMDSAIDLADYSDFPTAMIGE